MSMIDYAVLAEDIASGPLAEVCAPHVSTGYDLGIAALFNARDYTLVGRLSKSEFTLAILPATLALATKDADTQSKWDRILGLASVLESVDPSLPMVRAMLDLAVQDGLMTPEYRAAIGVRPASRAEVLFGRDTNIHHLDVAKALGRS